MIEFLYIAILFEASRPLHCVPTDASSSKQVHRKMWEGRCRAGYKFNEPGWEIR